MIDDSLSLTADRVQGMWEGRLLALCLSVMSLKSLWSFFLI